MFWGVKVYHQVCVRYLSWVDLRRCRSSYPYRTLNNNGVQSKSLQYRSRIRRSCEKDRSPNGDALDLWTSGPNEKRRVMGNFSGRLERVTTTDDDEVRGGLLRRQRSRRRQSILTMGRNSTLASSMCHSGGTIMRTQWESAYSRVYGLQRKEMCILFLMTTHSPTQQLLYSPLAVITRFTLSWPCSVSCSPIYSSVCYGFRSKKWVAFQILPENRVKLSQFCVTLLTS